MQTKIFDVLQQLLDGKTVTLISQRMRLFKQGDVISNPDITQVGAKTRRIGKAIVCDQPYALMVEMLPFSVPSTHVGQICYEPACGISLETFLGICEKKGDESPI